MDAAAAKGTIIYARRRYVRAGDDARVYTRSCACAYSRSRGVIFYYCYLMLHVVKRMRKRVEKKKGDDSKTRRGSRGARRTYNDREIFCRGDGCADDGLAGTRVKTGDG